MIDDLNIPIFGFVGYSGVGKTTLLVKILALLKNKGVRVGMIKHAHHHFDIDKPNKDSYRFRQAGASQMLIASKQRWALMVEMENLQEPDLKTLLSNLDTTILDLILVEGFKHEYFPKIEVHRPSLNQSLIFPQDKSVIAVATDAHLTVETNLPLLDLNNPEQIVDFIMNKKIPL